MYIFWDKELNLITAGCLFVVVENLKVDTIIIEKQDSEYENCTEFLKLTKSKKVKVISVEGGDMEKNSPQVAVIGVGEDNKYGHPNSDVMERLENLRKPSF